MRQVYLMTMGTNSINPRYHGIVNLDENDWIDGEEPIEDWGMWYYDTMDFPHDRDWMFNRFLSFMDDEPVKWY